MIRPLLVLAILFVSATLAHAECAWVLWSLYYGGSTDTVTAIISAHPEMSGCVKSLDRELIRQGSAKYSGGLRVTVDVSELDRGFGQVNFYGPRPPGTLTAYMVYRCLPDGTDPRGPKGK